MARRQPRQQAFEMIFESSFGNTDVESMIQAAGDARDAEISDYARRVTEGVFARREELDGIISRFSRGRSFRRLSRVVLTALRLSVYEILYVDDLDPVISINEAIELTKRFSGKDEAGFVHGVLGGFMKAYEAGEIRPQSAPTGEETQEEVPDRTENDGSGAQ